MTPELQPTLVAYETAAQATLTEANAAYFLSGAGAGQSSAENLDAFAQVSVRPRSLQDLRGGSAGVSVAGLGLSHPLIIAPFAYQKLLCSEGEIATAQAAAAQGTLMTLSAQSSTEMTSVRAAGHSCLWFQLYWQGDRQRSLALCQRAADAGFESILLTVDAPVHGVRDAEIHAEFSLPQGIAAVNLQDFQQSPVQPLKAGESVIFDRIAYLSPTWDDVEWLINNAPLPIMIKGILHPEDAATAASIGAQGIVVSNHGGRVLDGALASLKALPEIRTAVGPDVTVLMDGGIRRGIDIFKAIALGADAVLVCRPIIHGLAVAGAAGAAHVLRLLQDEFEIAMMLAGCRECSDIMPEKVHLNW